MIHSFLQIYYPLNIFYTLLFSNIDVIYINIYIYI